AQYLFDCFASFNLFLFIHHTVTSEIDHFSLHDALPICGLDMHAQLRQRIDQVVDLAGEFPVEGSQRGACGLRGSRVNEIRDGFRSEEHTSELQSREKLVCRLLLEKKK